MNKNHYTLGYKEAVYDIRQIGGMMTNYKPDEKQIATVLNNFTYHAPINDQQERYQFIRNEAKHLAIVIIQATPPSREQSLALTKLEESIFWANAAIARNET